ncbi:unnamed protein product [Microthlaspi erraticum]|uniref:Uncharacterized protein n=1 Tax=Microthlaspi erraticum TaxID=1685480 RepID=A0A6D2KY63_9BRAS|nr:unnamed protein product [Microthlaspi erraticum]
MLGLRLLISALPQPGDDSVRDIGSLFTANEKAEWSEIYSIGMTPCYASLVIVASHNWMPSTHSNHVSEPRAKLIYKLSTGVELILMQAPLPLLDDDVLIRQTSSSSSIRLHQRPSSLWILALSASHSTNSASAIQALGDIVYTLQTFTEVQGLLANLKVLVRHKAKKGEIEDATGLTQIVNQSGSASGRMDGHVAELSGA